MTSRGLILGLLIAATPVAAPAQARDRSATNERAWTAIRVAKWALLAGAAGFGAYALTRSTAAQNSYDELRELCAANAAACAIHGDRYPDDNAERLYQSTARADRQAQIGITGGQVALLGSVALFIYDLRNGQGPVNIPYPAPGATAARAARLPGLTLRLSF